MKPEFVGHRSVLCRLRFAAALALMAIGGLVHAQSTAPAPTAGSLLQSILEPRPATKVGATVDELLRRSPPIGDVEGLRINVSAFRLKGLSAAKEADFLDSIRPFTGQGKRFQDLLDAASTVRAALVSRGYFLADVLIPVQSTKDGIVELVVLEGKLGRLTIQIADGAGVSEATVRKYLSALEEGTLLTTATVERAIFLLGDLKGIEVGYNFSPGTATGTADLKVTVARANKFGGVVDVDLNGSVYTGVTRIGAGFDINNVIGQGDFINLRVLSGVTLDTKRGVSKEGLIFNRLSYLSPLGAAGTKVGAAYSVLRYELGREFTLLQPTGDATVSSFIVLHPFIRARNLNLIGTVQYDLRKFEDRLAAVAQVSRNETSLVSATIGGDVRDDFGRGGTTTFGFSATRGKLTIADPNDALADDGTLKSAGNYQKYNIVLTRLQRFLGNTTLYLSLARQVASKNLNTSEKFSLGGPNGVRAYPQGEGVGDEGFVANLEWRTPLSLEFLKYVPGNAVLVAFVDYGTSKLVKKPYQPTVPNTAKISGVGLGLNWGLGNDWSLRSSLAWRQSRAPTSETIDDKPRFFLQVSRSF